MRVCPRDLKDDIPPSFLTQKLELWDKQWEEQKRKYEASEDIGYG